MPTLDWVQMIAAGVFWMKNIANSYGESLNMVFVQKRAGESALTSV